MADYYKNDDDKIVNTEPTPLDPSPKVVVVENEETGELAPSPKLEADVLVEGEQNKDAKIVGQAPIKSTIPPVREMTYTDLVNVIKANAPEAEDVKAEWGKITGTLSNQTDLSTALNGKAQVYSGAYVGDETKFTKDMKVGDIIAESTGGKYIINEITFTGNTLTKVVLLGLEDNATPTKETYESGSWTSADYNPAPALAGKYVRIMDAPTSTTLTEEQKAQIAEGCFIDGDFLNIHNPVFYPFESYPVENNEVGIVMGLKKSTDQFIIAQYKIVGGVISLGSEYLNLHTYGDFIGVYKLSNINGKTIPAYPSNTGTFTLKCVDGILTWVEEV